MEVIKNQIDELNLTLTLNVSKDDVAENVEKALKHYRNNAEIRGFRKGNAPMSLIKKMYGKAVLADEVNKFVGKSLNDYLVTEKLEVLGEPLPQEDMQTIDLEKEDNYKFVFDLGLAPAFEVKLSKRDKINQYNVVPTAEDIEKHIEGYCAKYGKYEDVETSTAESMLTGDLIEIAEDGSELTDGKKKENAYLAIEYVKDEEIKKNFIGVSVDTIIDFDLKKAVEEAKAALLLGCKKEEVANLSNNFRFIVKTVKEYRKAEINQDLFDKSFGAGEVKSEEEFRTRVEEEIKSSFTKESKYKMYIDLKEKVMKKIDVKYPEAYLKRWAKATNPNFNAEELEKEFPRYLEDLTWSLVMSKVSKEAELKVEKEEIVHAAKEMLKYQFAQYGMAYVPEEYLEKYSQEVMQREEDVRRLYDQVLQDKVLNYLSEQVKLEPVEVSMEEFSKLFA